MGTKMVELASRPQMKSITPSSTAITGMVTRWAQADSNVYKVTRTVVLIKMYIIESEDEAVVH